MNQPKSEPKPKKKRVYKPKPVSKPKPPRVELKLHNSRKPPEPLYVGKLKDAQKHLKEMKAYMKDHGITCADPKALCTIYRGDLPFVIIPDKRLWDNMIYTLKVIEPLSEKVSLSIRANPAGMFRLVHIKSKDKSLGLEMARIYIDDEENKYNIGFGAYSHFVEIDAGLYRRHWGSEADKLGREVRK